MPLNRMGGGGQRERERERERNVPRKRVLKDRERNVKRGERSKKTEFAWQWRSDESCCVFPYRFSPPPPPAFGLSFLPFSWSWCVGGKETTAEWQEESDGGDVLVFPPLQPHAFEIFGEGGGRRTAPSISSFSLSLSLSRSV